MCANPTQRVLSDDAHNLCRRKKDPFDNLRSQEQHCM